VTAGLGLLLGLLLLAAPAAVPAGGRAVEITVDPAMVKGPADAPVTIVEFSDYQ
jgi:protein-disulfide isomerase